ncbi:MAG: 30S ribosomal protein S2 [Patescibacteria group bacterium]|jgi:small subunit ribosomal protein S2|nr:30S ribosomal protein S2 [Patescibacteria group bacterium]
MTEKEVKEGQSEKQVPVSPQRTQSLELNKEDCELSLERLLKAGVHFGQKKSRWNPKMDNYLFGVRNGIHIIDLEKSLEMYEKALKVLEEIVKKNGKIMIVGTKQHAKELVRKVGEELKMPYVNERWIGGTFTNFGVISKRIKYLEDNREGLEKGKFSYLTKLERLKLTKELDGLEVKIGGLLGMRKIPEAVFILDINKDKIALKEARKAGVKIVGLVDSNSNPDLVDYAIPANDDAISSLKYILEVFLCRIIKAGKTENTENKEKGKEVKDDSTNIKKDIEK